jgi:arylsulfatase A-like enzyme
MIRGLLLAGCAAFSSCAQSAAEATDVAAVETNVLVIVMDDVGCDAVSTYGQHPDAPPTPALDALAKDGVLFRRAYAHPLCSPTRA